jgi:hypothetical protein
VELLMLYFFRIALLNYRSAKAQSLQLDLRIHLCRFIQNYATEANGMRTAAEKSLEKFETLIFSGIAANEETLPTTFDGLDHLAKLVKSIKG